MEHGVSGSEQSNVAPGGVGKVGSEGGMCGRFAEILKWLVDHQDAIQADQYVYDGAGDYFLKLDEAKGLLDENKRINQKACG